MTEWLWPGGWRLEVAVLALAVALDALLPEPPMLLHPVAWMGAMTRALTRVAPKRGRVAPLIAGVIIATATPAMFGAAAAAAGYGLHHIGWPAYLIGGAALLKTSFAVRGLAAAALQVSDPLARNDLLGARTALRGLVSRDTSQLSAAQAASATVESVAENTADSYIGPWLAFAAMGLPGALAYRAVNTLDSMIGYRGALEYLGKAAARLDDVVNCIPARLSAMLMLLAAMIARDAKTGLAAGRGWRTLRTERRRTASPNAGWTMAAMAGLLGVRLEKAGQYVLGEGFREPGPVDVLQAIRVAYLVATLGLMVTAGLVVGRAVLVG